MRRRQGWRRRVTALAPASMLLVLAGCSGWATPLHEKTVTVTAPHVADTPLLVETANGAIEVDRTDGQEVLVTAKIRATTLERLDAVSVLAERQPDGTLKVWAQWPEPGRESNEGCGFDVATPGVSAVTLRTSNGQIRITGLSGPAELDTSNGRVEAHLHAGSVDADTSNGGIEMSGITGPVRADTSNGSVKVELAQSNPGPVAIETSNGSIRLGVGTAFAGRLSAKTSNGSVRTSGVGSVESSADKSVAIRFVNAGDSSTLSTSNGSITIEASRP